MPKAKRNAGGTKRWSVHQGDALAWLQTLADDSVDAVVTDPPYSSGGRTATERRRSPKAKYIGESQRAYPQFPGDGRDQRSWQKWMTLWLSESLRIARPGAPLCLFSDWRQLPAASDALQMAGWVWRGLVAWDKTAASRPTLGRFRQQAEFVVWGSKGAMPTSRRCNAASNVLPGVLNHRVDPRDKHHLTGKPTSLMLDIVRICEPGGTIVDPFAGSGTTGVAALKLGYRFVGCELQPEYVSLARTRLRSTAA